MEVHPFHPWLLTAHKNSSVIVWNYELKKVLYDINLQSLDDDDIATLGGSNALNSTGGTAGSGSTASGSGGASAGGSSGGVSLGAVGSSSSASGTGLNTIVAGSGTPTSSHTTVSGGGGTARELNSATQSSSSGGGASMSGGGSGNLQATASGAINSNLGSQSSDPATKQQNLEKRFGQIKAIKFYDKHTKRLKALTENTYRSFLYSSSPTSSSLAAGSSDATKKSGSLIGFDSKKSSKKAEDEEHNKKAPLPTTSSLFSLGGPTEDSVEPNTIIILTEHRVLFFDYETLSFSEIRLSSFEHKAPLSVDFFSDVPFLCFGGLFVSFLSSRLCTSCSKSSLLLLLLL